MEKILIFIIFLGPLIFFHELGHYFFARLFGVRVETFSLGFGPKIFKFKRGDTDYAISLIPLGGYVKMYGDDPTNPDGVPESQRKFAFNHKSKWERFWIVFGGPFFNFIFAYIIYFALLVGGEKVPEIRFGYVPTNSSYYQLGLRSGDRLAKLNQVEVTTFDDFNLMEEQIKNITVKRDGESIKIPLEMNAMKFLEDFSSFFPHLRRPVLIDKSGQRFGVSTVEGKFDSEVALEKLIHQDSSTYYIYPLKGENDQPDFSNGDKYLSDADNDLDFFSNLKGYYPADLMINSIVLDSAAANAGLKQGDIIVSVNGNFVTNFEQIREEIQSHDVKTPAEFVILRDGELKTVGITPKVQEVNGKEVRMIGVYRSTDYIPGKLIESPARGFGESFLLAWTRTLSGIEKTFMGLKKIITNEVPLKNIGGPISIGMVASDSFDRSLSYFFNLMAIISINLGLINLFPVPVLDGGHIMFIIFEIFNRGPISKKKMIAAQQFGVLTLFLLIFVALYNDFSRFF